jgi:hypothetical protein
MDGPNTDGYFLVKMAPFKFISAKTFAFPTSLTHIEQSLQHGI